MIISVMDLLDAHPHVLNYLDTLVLKLRIPLGCFTIQIVLQIRFLIMSVETVNMSLQIMRTVMMETKSTEMDAL